MWLQVPGLLRTNIDLSSWGRTITWQSPFGDAAMTFYTTVHLLNPSIAQKQHVVTGKKDGCLPVSWQVTQFNLSALSTIISIPRQDERKKKKKFSLNPLLHLFPPCLFMGKAGFVLTKSNIAYMLILGKNNIGHAEVWEYWPKLRGQGSMFQEYYSYV